MGGGGRLGGGKTRRGAAEAILKTDAGARAGAAPLTPLSAASGVACP